MEENKLVTEVACEDFYNIDSLDTLDLIKLINEQNKYIPLAIEKEYKAIARSVDEISKRYIKGGRLIYIGAGSSGRIGVLDAVELTPTYNVSPTRAFGIIAGGNDAMFRAIEGAEDSVEQAILDLKNVELNSLDSLISIAASGNTPYSMSAIEYGKQVGALTIAITNNENSMMSKLADIAITTIVGPEIVSGSTRMKAGTAQKMIVNSISTTLMVRLGKVYKNYMINVQATNGKLMRRSINIIQNITNLNLNDATALFEKSDHNVARAIVMHKTECDIETAKIALKSSDDRVREAINLINKNNLIQCQLLKGGIDE